MCSSSVSGPVLCQVYLGSISYLTVQESIVEEKAASLGVGYLGCPVTANKVSVQMGDKGNAQKCMNGQKLTKCAHIVSMWGHLTVNRHANKSGDLKLVGDEWKEWENTTERTWHRHLSDTWRNSVKYLGWVESSDGVLRVFWGVDRKGLASTCKKLHPSHLLLP